MKIVKSLRAEFTKLYRIVGEGRNEKIRRSILLQRILVRVRRFELPAS